MNARTPLITIPALGTLMEGGYFHGVVLIDGQLWGEVTGPKAACNAGPANAPKRKPPYGLRSASRPWCRSDPTRYHFHSTPRSTREGWRLK